MAKKGAQVQLQAEINNEEDWEKLLERQGLIIVDVYSEWCGPCASMSANLKKIKLEIGGDNLHLAMAKSDNIACLERFRDKSEPTWMFIASKKMVNLMFGANAPKLTRLIVDELKKEVAALEGSRTRDEIEFSELAPEEKSRFENAERERLERDHVEIEAEKKKLNEKMVAHAESLLEPFSNYSVVLIFPLSVEGSHAVLADLWEPAGVKVQNKEKRSLKLEQLKEMLYFAETSFNDAVVASIEAGVSEAYLVKSSVEGFDGNFDDLILKLIYGEMKHAPGSTKSPALALRFKRPAVSQEDVAEKDSHEGAEALEIDGVWVPPNHLSRATAIKVLYPALAAIHLPPEPEPIPPHIAITFDAFKRSEVAAVIADYPDDVMRFGFFTDDKPETAKLIAKTAPQFEKKAAETQYGEKLVVQLSKKRSDAVLAFASLGPSYMSPNAVEGERECKLFFPKDYDEPEMEEVVVVKKKPSKRRGKRHAAPSAEGAQEAAKIEDEDTFIEGMEAGEGDIAEDGEEAEGDVEGEGQGEGDEGEAFEEDDETGEEMPDEMDKATSPMTEE